MIFEICTRMYMSWSQLKVDDLLYCHCCSTFLVAHVLTAVRHSSIEMNTFKCTLVTHTDYD
jgi:hypothetical protein